MRHVAKRKKPKLNSFTNIKQLLHSKTGKSTYFYKQRWFSYSIPLASTLALLLVMGLCINPVGRLSGDSSSNSKKVYAADNIPGEPGYDDIVPENGVALRIDTTLNDKDTIEEQVSGTGTQYIKVDFTVGANNIQNYDVYVQADSTALTGQSHGDKLQSITSDSTGTVGTKEWGYSVSRGDVDPSTMTYRPIQTSVSTSADSQDAGEGKTLTGISQPYTLAFAANLEGAVSDHYKSNITLSVAAGAGEVVNGFNGITKMQEMVASVCHSAPFGEEGQLTDTRDNKTYWIAKLSDGNCWMTQNLDLNIPASGLSKNDTDIPVDWNSSSTYKPEATQTITSPNFGTTNNNIKSWNPGANGGEKYCNTSGCNLTTSTNNGHDAQGNYYSWGAATAGQAASLTSSTAGEQATQSICPKGWRLPTGGNNGEFYVAFNGMTVADLITKPYYFVYGGYVGGSSLNYAGSRGYYWSSTAYNADYAYTLYFTTSVNPSDYYNRYIGYSVRCVAR